MPVGAVESVELDISDDDPLTLECLPFEPQAKRLPNDAVSAVAADEESSLEGLHRPVGVSEHGRDGVCVLLK